MYSTQSNLLYSPKNAVTATRTRSVSLFRLVYSSLLHSVNLILFTVLLVHLILRISPHHSHQLRSHHLSLPLPFTPDLKLISFTNAILHSHSYSFRTDFMDLNLYWIKGALLCLFYLLATCARLSCILGFRVHVKLFYRIVSYSQPLIQVVNTQRTRTIALDNLGKCHSNQSRPIIYRHSFISHMNSSGYTTTSSKICNYITKTEFFCKLLFSWEYSKTRQAWITHLWWTEVCLQSSLTSV